MCSRSTGRGDRIAVETAVQSPPRFAAFQLPAFRLLWLNNSGFNLGMSIQRFAYVWLVLEIGGGAASAGLVTFALGIPVFVFGLPAGSLADRRDKRNLLVWSQLGALVASAATAAAIWTGVMTIPLAYLLAGCFGASTAFGQPVRSSIVPAIVERHLLMNAIVVMSFAMNLTLIVGPALGGATIRYAGIGGAFALAAALYGGGLFALFPLRLPPRAPSQDEATRGFRAAITFVLHTPGVRTLFAMLIASSLLLIGPYQAIIPQVARDKLGANALSASLLFTMLGIGTLVASLLLASLKRLPNAGGWFMVSFVVVGFTMAATGLSPWYRVTLAIMFAWGIGGGVYMNLNQTLVQSNTPLDLMGRVMSVYTVALSGLGPLGGLIAGAAASRTGAPAVAVACGFALAVVGALALLTQPSLRRL